MLFIAWGLMTGAVIADPCDDYDHAVDNYIQAIRLSGQKVDQATDAHQFADSVNLFASATEELTATLRDLSPQVTSLYQSRGNGPLPGCDRAQEKLVSFAPELNAIGTKFSEQVQKYISDPEVQKAFDRLRKLRFDSSERPQEQNREVVTDHSPGFPSGTVERCLACEAEGSPPPDRCLRRAAGSHRSTAPTESASQARQRSRSGRSSPRSYVSRRSREFSPSNSQASSCPTA